MKNARRWTLTAAVLFLCGSSCGLNPFGPGSASLDFFAKVGKAMKRPSQINEEEGSKNNSQAMISEGKAQAKRLAKITAAGGTWLDSNGIRSNTDGSYTYWEQVTSKPAENEPDKLVTGRGEVTFRYEGVPTLLTVEGTRITDVLSFHFIGREERTWKKGFRDSVKVTITFASTAVDNIKPGLTLFWGKNISDTPELGKGDTASFELDSLDEVNAVQYGEGHFLDSLTGKNNDEPSQPFDFAIAIHHKNREGGNPYLRYQDNEGIVTFMLPWGRAAADSLHFTIRFYPDHYREGSIRKNGPEGPVLVTFTRNEKTEAGTVIYYDEKGKEIGSDS